MNVREICMILVGVRSVDSVPSYIREVMPYVLLAGLERAGTVALRSTMQRPKYDINDCVSGSDLRRMSASSISAVAGLLGINVQRVAAAPLQVPPRHPSLSHLRPMSLNRSGLHSARSAVSFEQAQSPTARRVCSAS